MRPTSSNRRRWLLGALASLAVLAACNGQGPDGGKGGPDAEDEAPQEPDRRVLVDAAPVTRGDVADHLVTTGSLESEAQADIVPEASGVVTRILVEEGDHVTKGQLLAVLSNPSLQAGAQRAQVEIARARREAETARSLHARGAISDTELRSAEEALTTAEATFAEAAATSDFARIESPIDGTVAVRDLRIGELAGGGRAFQVVDLDRLRVIVQLPEKDLSKIRAGQKVVLQGAYDEEARGEGTVRRISPVVDSQSGTVRVTIDVDADTTDLRPGQFVKTRIEVDRHTDVLTIPRRALVWIDGQPVAWTVVDAEWKPEGEEEGADKADQPGDDAKQEEPGFFAKLMAGDKDKDAKDDEPEGPPPWPLREAARADLEIGFSDPALVEVLSGLEEGDLVVTVGNNNLRGGTPLRLPQDPGPEARDAKKQDAGEAAEGEQAGEAADGDQADDAAEGEAG